MTSPDGVHSVTDDPSTGQGVGLSAPGSVGKTFTYYGALPSSTTWGGPTSTTWSGPVVRGTVGVAYDDALRPFELSVGAQSLGHIFYSPDGLPKNIGSPQESVESPNPPNGGRRPLTRPLEGPTRP